MVRVITTLRPLFSKLGGIPLYSCYYRSHRIQHKWLEVLSFPLNPRPVKATLVHSRLLQKIFLCVTLVHTPGSSFGRTHLIVLKLLLDNFRFFNLRYQRLKAVIPNSLFEGLKGIPWIFLIRNMILFALNNSSISGLKVVCLSRANVDLRPSIYTSSK